MDDSKPDWNIRLQVIGIIATVVVGIPALYDFVEARIVNPIPGLTPQPATAEDTDFNLMK